MFVKPNFGLEFWVLICSSLHHCIVLTSYFLVLKAFKVDCPNSKFLLVYCFCVKSSLHHHTVSFFIIASRSKLRLVFKNWLLFYIRSSLDLEFGAILTFCQCQCENICYFFFKKCVDCHCFSFVGVPFHCFLPLLQNSF